MKKVMEECSECSGHGGDKVREEKSVSVEEDHMAIKPDPKSDCSYSDHEPRKIKIDFKDDVKHISEDIN